MNDHLRLIATATLPLLFTIGCANTDSKPLALFDAENASSTALIQDENSNVNESVKLAINNMEGYLNRMNDRQAVNNETQLNTLPSKEITNMTVLIVEERAAFAEAPIPPSTTESDEIDQLINAESSIPPAPEKTKFFFGFNKTQLDQRDMAILNQHAEYLLSNKNVILVISGHADNRGNKNYNQYLSELRAENIAKSLKQAGVPESQLRVGGMGDNVPMVDAAHWNENRRVELLYREALMLSSQ